MVVVRSTRVRRTLAEIVVEEKLAEADRVEAAARRARRTGEPLIVALVELEQIADVALVGALSRHLRLPIVDGADAEPEALREVAHELARRRRLLPLGVEVATDGARTLRVAMADPTDRDAIAEVEISTGAHVEPLLIALGAVDDAIARAYRGIVTAIMQSGPPAKRRPFGGDLHIATPALTTDAIGDLPGLGTEPFHRIEDEAPVAVRVRALVELLVSKGLITEEEYWTSIRRLLRGHDEHE
jgi:type IV pilus assembly protein PilB